MHRQSTLKQRMVLCLTAFFAALAAQIVLSFYQSGTVLRELDDQMGNFNAISRFQNGVERSLTALDDYRWEYGDTDALLAELDSRLEEIGLGRIVDGVGRGVVLDHDKNYGKVKRAYDTLTDGLGAWYS